MALCEETEANLIHFEMMELDRFVMELGPEMIPSINGEVWGSKCNGLGLILLFWRIFKANMFCYKVIFSEWCRPIDPS